MNNENTYLDILAAVTLTIVMILFGGYTAYKSWEYAGNQYKTFETKYQSYIEENCELAGWYGKYGTQKFYKCHGKLMKDSEIKEVIK